MASNKSVTEALVRRWRTQVMVMRARLFPKLDIRSVEHDRHAERKPKRASALRRKRDV